MTRVRLAPLLLILASWSTALAAEPPLWRVQGPRGSAVLFGSVHLLPAGLNWKTPALSDALAHADELWFEIPIGGASDAHAAKRLADRGRLPPTDTLAAHLPAALEARVERQAEMFGLAPKALAAMRPWMADATLAMASDLRSGAMASEGVERRIDAWTPLQTKRRALETADHQIAILAGGAPAEQVALLRVTLDEIESHPERYRTIVNAWLEGDLAKLEVEALTPLAETSRRAYDALIVERNRAWTVAIARRLRRKGRIVVVVGVGHLIGPDGLPDRLRAAGETVVQPSPSAAPQPQVSN